MLTLGLEISTSRGSAALAEDGALVAEKAWDERAYPAQAVIAVLPELWKEAGRGPAEVDLFAVGRGPGGYSGLRMAVSVARALALPGARPVVALSSAAVLAREVLRETDADRVAVCGDARRARVWFGVFRRIGEDVELEMGWGLASLTELETALPAGVLRVSADWPIVGPRGPARGPWIPKARFPRAGELVALAQLRWRHGVPSEALTPIYTHPPVWEETRGAGGSASP